MKFKEFFQILNESPFHDDTIYDPNALARMHTVFNNGELMRDAKKHITTSDIISFNGLKFKLKRQKSGNHFEDIFYLNHEIVGATVCYEKMGNFIQISHTAQNKKFKGLSRHLYLNYYLSMYGCIMSGDEQSSFGRGMWSRLIEAAFNLGKKVGAVNMVTHERKIIVNPKEAEKYYNGRFRNYNLTICN